MIIQRIEIANFKGIEALTVCPNGRDYAISGRNGTGKTSVMDAYLWCLTGKDGAGRTDFHIRPVGKTHIDVIVTVETDGCVFSRVNREVWTRPRGRAEEELTGTTTEYYLNGKPVKAMEYAEAVGPNIALWSQPEAFNALPWRERRKILMDAIGGGAKPEGYEDIAEFTGDVVTGRKTLNALRKACKQEAEMIDARLSEAERGLGDTSDERDVRYNVDDIAGDIERVRAMVQPTGNADDSRAAEESLKAAEWNLTNAERDRNVQTSIMDRAITGWRAAKGETFVDTVRTVCPTCGQELPPERVEAVREKARADFEADRKRRMDRFADEGRTAKERLGELDGRIETLRASVDDRRAALEALRAAHSADKAEQDKQHAAIEKRLTSLLERQRANAARLQQIEAIHAAENRVKELTERRRALGKEAAELDNKLMRLDEFATKQCELITEKINALFPQNITWQLFDVQMNGNITDCCECLVDGVPWNNVNTAGRINAGLAIIDALSDGTAPVWVDGAESVNEIFSTNAQMIILEVTNNDMIFEEVK